MEKIDVSLLGFRRAWAVDLPQVMRCLEALAPVGLDAASAAKVFQEQLHQGIQVWVATLAGEEVGSSSPPLIVGTGSLILERKLIHQGGLVGRIEDVAVLPISQGQGVGRFVVENLVSLARESGCYKVILCCKQGLIGWYRELGFQERGIEMRIDF